MIKQIVCASVGVAAWTLFAAEGVRPQTELIGSVEFAAFADVQQKIVDLGATINNPVVPMLAVPAIQNMLTEQFGKYRSDAPMKGLCYADVEALRKALAADDCSAVDALEVAFLYPCAEGMDAFLVNHPEAQKKADGVIELENGFVVLFAADGRTCAFASTAAVARRALAAPAPAAKAARPLVRLELTEAGLGLLAEFHKKVTDAQSELLHADGTNATDRVLSSFVKFQQAQARRQNAVLRRFSRMTASVDLDETGFVIKGSITAKPGASAPSAAGFTLPPKALDGVPAGAPLFYAVNPLLSLNVQNEQEYRALLDDIRAISDSVFDCVRQKKPENAPIVDGLRAAVADLLTAAPNPAPTDWSVGALAFGPRQEPYLVQVGACAKASQGSAAVSRFYAAVAGILGKKWPGIVSANGATLSVDWNRLVDVVAAETGGSQASADSAKKTIKTVLGGTASEISTVMPSQTSYRTYAGVKGFTPPAAAPFGEGRFAAVVPEAVANRPCSMFYLSLYSLVRDNVLPIVLKAVPDEEKAQIKAVVDVLPPAGANGAMAVAAWYEKSGSCSFLFRITKDEIKNLGAAVNAVMAAQAQSAE